MTLFCLTNRWLINKAVAPESIIARTRKLLLRPCNITEKQRWEEKGSTVVTVHEDEIETDSDHCEEETEGSENGGGLVAVTLLQVRFKNSIEGLPTWPSFVSVVFQIDL